MDDHRPDSAPDPGVVARLLNGADPLVKRRSWEEFVEAYTPLMIHAVSPAYRDHDGRMDAYQFVLESLSNEDYRRLRAFDPSGKARFSTWLVVVCRRLAYDHRRTRYGRAPSADDGSTRERLRVRERLVDLVGEELQPEHAVSPAGDDPEGGLRRRELAAKLEAVLATLPVRDRLLVRYRFDDGLPAREIAEAMRFPSVFHVYRRLKKVLKALREGLKETGVHDPEP